MNKQQPEGRPQDEIVETEQTQDVKITHLKHLMQIKIGSEVFKVYRTSKKSATLKWLGDV